MSRKRKKDEAELVARQLETEYGMGSTNRLEPPEEPEVYIPADDDEPPPDPTVFPQRKGTQSPGSYRKQIRKIKEFRQVDHQQKVAELYLKGYPQAQIATILDCGVSTVCKVLAQIKEEWVRRAAEHFDQRKAKELAKIDQIEQVAWEAWERSVKEQEVVVSKKEQVRQKVQGRKNCFRMVPIRETTEKQVRGQAGDPRFLERIQWCVETRLRVMGLMKGDQTNINQVVIDWSQLIGKPSASSDPLPLQARETSPGQFLLPSPTEMATEPWDRTMESEDPIEKEILSVRANQRKQGDNHGTHGNQGDGENPGPSR